MSKRTRYIIAVILTLAVVGFTVVALWPPQPGVTQANFDRVKKGMTLAEVEMIYGRPPDVSIDVDGDLYFIHKWVCPSGSKTILLISKDTGVAWKLWPEADETIVRKFHRWLFPEPEEPKRTA